MTNHYYSRTPEVKSDPRSMEVCIEETLNSVQNRSGCLFKE